MKYNKLIRNRIADQRRAEGKAVITHVAEDAEYWDKLRHKLREETAEYLHDENNEELADVLEVLYAIGDFKGIERERLEEWRKQKEQEKGGFDGRIILDEIRED